MEGVPQGVQVSDGRDAGICSIGGWYCFSDARPSPGIVKGLLWSGAIRGTDASGVAYLKGRDGKLYYRKDAMKAEDFIKGIPDKDWAEIATSRIGLLHNRAKTKGDEKNPLNNHPIVAYGWLVTHNGTIANDDDLFRHYKDTARIGEVDSMAIPLVLSQGHDLQASVQHTTLLAGSATFAAWRASDPDRLVLVRHGHHELYLFLDQAQRILYWSSAGGAVTWMPSVKFGSINLTTLGRLPDGKALVLTPNPEDVVVWKLVRSPFFGPRITSPASSSSGNTTPSSSPSLGRPGVVPFAQPSKVKPTWKWSVGESIAGKPEPLHTALDANWWDLAELIKRAKAADSRLVFETAYGRWHFESHGATRFFAPHHRVRDWWRRLDNAPEQPLTPGTIGVAQKMDNCLPLEHYIVSSPLQPGLSQQYPGYMCPWCGVWMRGYDWQIAQLRCTFCNIKSRLPSHEG